MLVDTETDGLLAPIHAVEIAAQRFIDFKPDGPPIRLFLNHGIPIPEEAAAIHGYTEEFLQEHGGDPAEAYRSLWTYVGGDHVVAHYARFDWDRVLVPESERLGVVVSGNLGFCSLALARRVLPDARTCRLDHLRQVYGLSGERAHSALGDIQATADLLTRVIHPRLTAIGFRGPSDWAFFARQPIAICRLLLGGRNTTSAREEYHRKRSDLSRKNRTIRDLELGSCSVKDIITEYDLVEEAARVSFEGRKFQFTGALLAFPRRKAKEAVLARGGLLASAKAVTRDLDYLVLGDASCDEIYSNKKVRAATLQRMKGFPNPVFVREEQFVASLAD